MKMRRGGFLMGLAIFAFTLYVALDSFVIARGYASDATQMNLSLFENVSSDSSEELTETAAASAGLKSTGRSGKRTSSAAESTTVPETAAETAAALSASLGGTVIGEYSDENISIVLSEYEEEGTAVYVADITLSSAQYLKTAFAKDTYGKNVTAKTSDTAAANDAILAINGDYYGAQESGYVIRNGVVYREKAGRNEVLCIYADGTLEVADPSDYSADELAAAGVWQAFSFGPGLVEDGRIAVSASEEVGKAMASNPRTAIGQLGELHYVFVVSDGRTSESEGLSLYQLAVFMQKLGVETAYNLDGGGSSSMVFMGELINKPTTSGKSIKERSVSDIVYIG